MSPQEADGFREDLFLLPSTFAALPCHPPLFQYVPHTVILCQILIVCLCYEDSFLLFASFLKTPVVSFQSRTDLPSYFQQTFVGLSILTVSSISHPQAISTFSTTQSPPKVTHSIHSVASLSIFEVNVSASFLSREVL